MSHRPPQPCEDENWKIKMNNNRGLIVARCTTKFSNFHRVRGRRATKFYYNPTSACDVSWSVCLCSARRSRWSDLTGRVREELSTTESIPTPNIFIPFLGCCALCYVEERFSGYVCDDRFHLAFSINCFEQEISHENECDVLLYGYFDVIDIFIEIERSSWQK